MVDDLVAVKVVGLVDKKVCVVVAMWVFLEAAAKVDMKVVEMVG